MAIIVLTQPIREQERYVIDADFGINYKTLTGNGNGQVHGFRTFVSWFVIHV